MSIRLFVTGGTFDKEYDEISGDLIFKETQVEKMLKLGRSNVDINIRTLMMVDSLFMTAEDRRNIVNNCKKAKENKILITHGTDTMVETAKELAAESINKTIILTGAMVPYAFGSSDGLFNLGSALSFCQTLKPGVYIAMNGKVFDWCNVSKNQKMGIFEDLN